jgi:membrane protease YdiL (CAAX protease family)
MWMGNRRVAFPDFRTAILLLLVLLAFDIGASYIVAVMQETTGRAYSSAAAGIGRVLGFLALAELVLRKRDISYKDILGTTGAPLLAYVAAILVSLGSYVLLAELDELIKRVLPLSERLKDWFALLYNPKDLLGGILVLCFVAPITEESIFRGVILSGFLNNYGKLKALLLSSCLFGLFHLNIWQFVGAFLIGLFLGFIYIRTGSILPSMLCHGIYNGLTIVPARMNLVSLSLFMDRLIVVNAAAVLLVISGVIVVAIFVRQFVSRTEILL